MNSEVDTYLSNATSWKTELTELRRIVQSCNLSEEFKWRIPVYCHQNANVVSICALKDSCVLSFFKGALLKDAQNILSKPGENTRSARVIRFSNVGEIIDIEPVLIEYIKEAVGVEESGLKFDFKKEAEVDLPAEVQAVFDGNSELKQAFDGLTPGRQRAYALYFSSAKQAKTRISRVEKSAARILDGKGLNDCTCGLSQKMPSCDGSHKSIR